MLISLKGAEKNERHQLGGSHYHTIAQCIPHVLDAAGLRKHYILGV